MRNTKQSGSIYLKLEKKNILFHQEEIKISNGELTKIPYCVVSTQCIVPSTRLECQSPLSSYVFEVMIDNIDK